MEKSFNLKLENGNNVRATFIKTKSASLHYGNCTVTNLYIDSEFRTSFDTRFNTEVNTITGFNNWCWNMIKSLTRPTVIITEI